MSRDKRTSVSTASTGTRGLFRVYRKLVFEVEKKYKGRVRYFKALLKKRKTKR